MATPEPHMAAERFNRILTSRSKEIEHIADGIHSGIMCICILSV